MSDPVVSRPVVSRPVPEVVSRLGAVFRVFDQQDSGCVSYGVRGADGVGCFVKVARTATGAESLRRAVQVHTAVRHPALVAPTQVLADSEGPVLVYPWVDGDVLYHATVGPDGVPTSQPRSDPGSPMARFRRLPLDAVRRAVDTVLDVHQVVDEAGLVAVDLYDGCFLYDWDAGALHVIDADEYRPGPFVTHEQLPGSRRFFAPEELGTGQVVDRRTTVYRLGRVARLLMDAGDTESAWRGTQAELGVIARATQPEPAARYQCVRDLVAAWRAAS
ncbi:serine/threonine protein kinase [Angustibacter sp. McL0619]|uniref:serine/threonine protein kinase n=1 Tax=Angustibacter sp. McL0619 TaxID=3415676 RepID=UPI003CF874ED